MKISHTSPPLVTPRLVILTGKKGVGKSTIVRNVVGRLQCQVGGFRTEPVLEDGQRIGYQLVDLTTGANITIARRVPESKAVRGGPFAVEREAFDQFGAAVLSRASKSADVIVMDEIGCMEQGAPLFQEAVRACLASGRPVICVVQAGKCDFVRELLAKYRADVLHVSPGKMEKARLLLMERLRQWGVRFDE